MRQCYVFWRTWCLFGENDLLTPVTPNDPWWIFRTITFVEGVKLMHMHKSRINAKYFVGLDAFWWKWPFWPQWPHPDLWPHHCLCLSSGQHTGHCDQVWSKLDVWKYVKKTCCQKERRRRRRRRRKRKREENSILRLRRQDKLDMRPLPRARVKLGGWTRSPHFWWKKPFDPCDPNRNLSQ